MSCASTRLRSKHVGQGLSLDNRLFSLASRHPVIVVGKVGALHKLQEFFVVGDDNQLEIRLLPSCSNDVVQRLRKRSDVVVVEVRRRLIQSNQPTVDPEALGQGEPDDDTRKNFLSRTASAPHVHLGLLLDHAHPVIVRSVAPRRFIVGTNQDSINVGALISLLPKLFDDAVDLLHLDAMVPHDRPVQTLVKRISLLES